MPAREIPWRRWMPWLVVPLVLLVGVALLLPAIQQAREAARRSHDLNNLKQLGLALHNYHDAYKCFPPGSVVSESGIAQHGWMTSILPFLDGAPTYAYIDFDYPWDDPVNEHVFAFSHPTLVMPAREPLYTTEGFGVAQYTGNPREFYRNSSLTLGEMGEGASHTWMVRNQFVGWQPWGAPFNWRELDWPVPGIDGENGWSGGVGLHVLMADGSVRFAVQEDVEALAESDRRATGADAAAQRKRPEIRYEYAAEGFGWTWLELDDAEYDGLSASAWNDADGEVRCVHIRPSAKVAERSLSLDDLRKVVERFPEARILVVCHYLLSDYDLTDESLTLSDEAVELLLQMPRLEVVRLGPIDVTDAGIAGLKKMTSLKILAGSASDQMQARLREALPDCELRLTLR